MKKKQNKDLRKIAKYYIDEIITNPKKGELLEHPFRKYQIRSTHFSFNKVAYRIAYTINTKEQEILFLLIDARENFYDKLHRQM